MNLSALTLPQICQRLREDGLVLQTGPFAVRIQSPIASLANDLALLYQDYPLPEESHFVDFSIVLEQRSRWHRWLRPQAVFMFDGQSPFEPLPLDHAFPLLEWSMNWCISAHAHQYLILHSAVIERDGCAVIMPAPPGSGKSTLCAGLVNRGWRLLSDELALISLADGTISPLCRPISLKNQSIYIIQAYAPDAVLNRPTHDTTKGTVTHMKVPGSDLARIQETAKPRWVIFPKYVKDAVAQLTPHSRAQSVLELARNSFNYMVLGLTGFEVLSDVVEGCDCYDFEYSQLDDAVAIFESLVSQNRSR
jgi:HprK-related kinase A